MNNNGVAQDKNLRQYGEFLVKGAYASAPRYTSRVRQKFRYNVHGSQWCYGAQ